MSPGIMKIALTVDPELPVPPSHYGGIERVVDLLAHGLVERGHRVTLFAHRDSRSAGRLVGWPGMTSQSTANTLQNALILARHVIGGNYDIVHSFSRIAYLTPLLPLRLPKVMTYQRSVTPRSVRLGHILSRDTLSFTAISRWMTADVMQTGRWDLVPNGVPLKSYDPVFEVADDAPLVFLGRVEEIKGPHLAVEIARRTGKRLIIAGNIPADKKNWFEATVRPHIDEDRVSYVGPVNDCQKNDLLGAAAALLMPILWEEPFGIVMAEALACGTPVLGLRRGAVSEVVDDGETGYVRDSIDELVEAVGQLMCLDRRRCRAVAEERYSDDAVVEGYLRVYRRRLRH